ncbi:Gfo/Idh/MocA family protein [Subtercola vilae]|uniref:Gfo/Idh/MocA family oxidoreductase n=1 Tax=Subtercola vilae TaxID=2056433 RepID=A0A4T2C2P9_9MICO|nr:Gfo/Idh/MocA family oxidoreductase [Subtercola vilae]TIH36646.1 gfo/Idh/MocA family oxidoreductase [Subtercola vilae]
MNPQHHPPLGVGILGAGTISDTYLQNLRTFPTVDVRFVADLDGGRANTQAAKFGVDASGTMDEMLRRADVDIVVNLTVPAVHARLSLQALHAGKHVWTEKPIGLDRTEASTLLTTAVALNLRIGSAPDTFLGAATQTALALVADGRIGEPQRAVCVFETAGPESWHPNPEFLYQRGGGPLFDMGPYYITTLVQVFGAVTRVTATASTTSQPRQIGSGPRAGEFFTAEVETTVSALVQFVGGASAQLLFSFDSHRERTGLFEVSGTAGTLVFPDPNRFVGDSVLYDAAHPLGSVLPAAGHEASRGTGIAELAEAIRDDRPARASGELGFHVLDVLLSIQHSSALGESVEVTSTIEKAQLLRHDWSPRA